MGIGRVLRNVAWGIGAGIAALDVALVITNPQIIPRIAKILTSPVLIFAYVVLVADLIAIVWYKRRERRRCHGRRL